ncbi:MAG: fatty acid/phospholipid synthesis protein PlsX [Lachnospiraceae bacterium]|nr:fatty acid/phospholipid synthesis protein PlsX [Lachnospiraceae bacterium]
MNNEFFEALINADDEPIVICDVEHVIVYMNTTAIKRYEKRGGEALVGKSIFDCHNAHSVEIIQSVVARFRENPNLNKVFTYSKNWDGADSDAYMVALRNKSGELIGYYEKHESRIHEKDK